MTDEGVQCGFIAACLGFAPHLNRYDVGREGVGEEYFDRAGWVFRAHCSAARPAPELEAALRAVEGAGPDEVIRGAWAAVGALTGYLPACPVRAALELDVALDKTNWERFPQKLRGDFMQPPEIALRTFAGRARQVCAARGRAPAAYYESLREGLPRFGPKAPPPGVAEVASRLRAAGLAEVAAETEAGWKAVEDLRAAAAPDAKARFKAPPPEGYERFCREAAAGGAAEPAS